MRVCGSGSGGYTMMLSIEQHWPGYNSSDSHVRPERIVIRHQFIDTSLIRFGGPVLILVWKNRSDNDAESSYGVSQYRTL